MSDAQPGRPAGGPIGEIRWITIDVADLDRGAAFWTAVLGVREIDRDGAYLWSSRLAAGGPGVVLQRTDDVKTVKTRIHLDIAPFDPSTAVERVVALGGTVVSHVREPTFELAVVADPDGNEMCLDLRSSDEVRRAARRRTICCGDRVLVLGERTYVIGVVNVTPDSFSDGGRFLDATVAYRHAMEMFDDGADIVDLGGESTRPGSVPIGHDEELRRIIPVIERLATAGHRAISIDTRHALVAAAALEAGAAWVNDVSGLADPQLAGVAAGADALVVMHNRLSGFAPVEDDVHYDDVVTEVCAELARLVEVAVAGGVARDRVVVDPGLGFGKTVAGNVALLRSVGRLAMIGPVLLGPSRKRFLGAIAGIDAAGDRDAATIGACLVAAEQGCDFVRVHDARGVRQALAVHAAGRRH